jgi:hypothetical protein
VFEALFAEAAAYACPTTIVVSLASRDEAALVNDWLALLRVILSAAVADYDLERNPVARVDDVDTFEHHTTRQKSPTR